MNEEVKDLYRAQAKAFLLFALALADDDDAYRLEIAALPNPLLVIHYLLQILVRNVDAGREAEIAEELLALCQAAEAELA